MKSFGREFSFGILYRYSPYISTVYLTDIVVDQVLFQDNNNPIILCPVSLYQAELLLRDWLWHKQDNAADIISEMLGWDAAGAAQWSTVGAQVARAHLHLLTPEVTIYRGHVTRHTYHQPHISHFYGMEGWRQLTITQKYKSKSEYLSSFLSSKYYVKASIGDL